MSVEHINSPPKNRDVIGKEGELEGLLHTYYCYRCGRDPNVAHDRFFCPAFASYADAGRWLPFPEILHAFRKRSKGSLSVWTTNRVEEHEGPEKTWHHVVGIAFNNRYAGRFDAPEVPEFSIFEPSDSQYDADHGSVAASTVHNMLYKGWRCSLRDTAKLMNIPWPTLSRDLGIPPDRSSEEHKRRKSGWL